MKNEIVTTNVYPPIPDRSHDWAARFTWDDDEEALTGEGETEANAVLDLLIKGVEDDSDGSAAETVVDMAFRTWEMKTATWVPGGKK